MRNIALFGVQADRACILPLPDSKQNRRMRIAPTRQCYAGKAEFKKSWTALVQRNSCHETLKEQRLK